MLQEKFIYLGRGLEFLWPCWVSKFHFTNPGLHQTGLRFNFNLVSSIWFESQTGLKFRRVAPPQSRHFKRHFQKFSDWNIGQPQPIIFIVFFKHRLAICWLSYVYFLIKDEYYSLILVNNLYFKMLLLKKSMNF